MNLWHYGEFLLTGLDSGFWYTACDVTLKPAVWLPSLKLVEPAERCQACKSIRQARRRKP